MKRRKMMQRNSGWNTTRIIGAITLTMKQLGFSKEDIDLTVFGTTRIRQRFAMETIEKAGILWVSRTFPEEFFRGMWDDDMGDVLQNLADDFEIRIKDVKNQSADDAGGTNQNKEAKKK